jgi:hypothetical protein
MEGRGGQQSSSSSPLPPTLSAAINALCAARTAGMKALSVLEGERGREGGGGGGGEAGLFLGGILKNPAYPPLCELPRSGIL